MNIIFFYVFIETIICYFLHQLKLYLCICQTNLCNLLHINFDDYCKLSECAMRIATHSVHLYSIIIICNRMIRRQRGTKYRVVHSSPEWMSQIAQVSPSHKYYTRPTDVKFIRKIIIFLLFAFALKVKSAHCIL